MTERWQLALAAVVVLGVTTWGFAPVVDFPFVNYDDPIYVKDNPQVRAGLTLEGTRWAFTTGHASNWHPLTWLSHLADVELFGLDAGAHHRTNLFLHLVSVLVVLLLVHRWSGRVLVALFVAALFAWHPTRAESVVWIAERKDVLSGLLLWLTLGVYTAYGRRPSRGRYLGVALFFTLALMAKPMVVTAPCLLLLLDVWPLQRLPWPEPGGWQLFWGRVRPLVVEKLPLFALAVVSSGVTVWVQRAGGAVSNVENVPLLGRLAHGVVAYGTYLKMGLWPVHLGVLYPHPGWPSPGAFAVSLSVLVAVSWAGWRWRRQCPALLVGWLWFLGTLVPVIGLVQVGEQGWADRYTYVPYVGLALALGMAFVGLTEGRSLARPARALGAVATGLALVAMLALVPLSRAQVLYWRDSETLFRHTLAVTGDNPVMEHILGITLLDGGDAAAAVSPLRRAVRLRPGFAEAHNALGIALSRLGQGEAAAAALRAAIALEPDNGEFRNNLGHALEAAGQGEAAVAAYREAVARAPDAAVGYQNLGVTLARMGRLAEAEAALRDALRRDPEDAATLGDLGNVLAQQGRVGEAVERYREALRRDPQRATVRRNLATLLTALGREQEAMRVRREGEGP
jgi:Flp pilus assembly protein TadD